jgi:thiosulfate reductase cytochrome b subunit
MRSEPTMASTVTVPLWIRLWHGVTALLFIVLTITGVVVHFAAPGFTPVGYAIATWLHDVCGILLAILYGIHLIFVFATGYWRHYVPARRGLWRRLKAQVVFYTIGLGRDESSAAVPPAAETRFNALQQLTYLVVVLALLPLLIVSGLLYLYYPAFVPDAILGLDGLWPVALAHYALAILGTTYLIIHLYMATVGPKAGASLRLMTSGRAEPATRANKDPSCRSSA